MIKEELSLCECGCGKPVAKKGNKYIYGHYTPRGGKNAPNYGKKHPGINKKHDIDVWLKENRGKRLCECGCGRVIKIERYHYTRGIPKYVHGHNARRDRGRFLKVSICEYCGIDFESNSSYSKKYCSVECRYKALGESLSGREEVPRFTKVCETCGIEFTTTLEDRRFCGNACRLVFFRTVSKGLTHTVSDELREVIRKNSQKQWSDIENRIKMSCIKLGIDRDEWDGFAQQYCYKWNKGIRQQIREDYSDCDFMSGLPDCVCNVVDGKVEKLSVHHVDYNKMQGCDDHEWKLVPLSRLNHGRTVTNRSFWERLICYAIEYDKTYYEV